MFGAWYAMMSWAGLTTALHVGEGEVLIEAEMEMEGGIYAAYLYYII